MSDALSLINITQVDVEANRHAINGLVNATDYLLEQTKEISDIKDELSALRTFVITHTELNLIVTGLRGNINKFWSSVENLELTLDTLVKVNWHLLLSLQQNCKMYFWLYKMSWPETCNSLWTLPKTCSITTNTCLVNHL